jgi:hypothetical protein
MEVGKLILNVVKSKATMTLSVKPFGCMPSSGVSDGVQSLITETLPGTIFCAVETSGDGAVNFQSRVQMYLFKARQAAQAEFERALGETGLSFERFREFLAKNPRFGAGLHHPEHRAGTTTADLVYEVAEVIDRSALERAGLTATRLGKATVAGVRSAAASAPDTTRAVASFLKRASSELFGIAKEKAPQLGEQALGAARQRLARVLPFAAASSADEAEAVAVAAE